MTQEEFIKLCVEGDSLDLADNDINAMAWNGNNAIITAVTLNKPKILEQLIGLGVDINATSSAGHNALTYAAIMAAQPEGSHIPRDIDPRVITLLVGNGADYQDAVMVAIRSNSESFADALFSAGADPNFADESGRTFVMYSVMSGGGILRTLLEHGADPNTPDPMGRTPLMIAAIDDETDPAVIDTLLEFGADIEAHDNKGLTALMWAVVSADKNPNAVLPALIRTGGLRAEGWELWSAFIALYTAAKREIQLDRVRKFIRAGADVNAIDNNGMNAMMYALVQGDDETADILSEAGATINFDMN